MSESILVISINRNGILDFLVPWETLIFDMDSLLVDVACFPITAGGRRLVDPTRNSGCVDAIAAWGDGRHMWHSWGVKS